MVVSSILISSGRTISKETIDTDMGITEDMAIIGEVATEDIIEVIMDLKISLIHRIKEDIKIKCNIHSIIIIFNTHLLHLHLWCRSQNMGSILLICRRSWLIHHHILASTFLDLCLLKYRNLLRKEWSCLSKNSSQKDTAIKEDIITAVATDTVDGIEDTLDHAQVHPLLLPQMMKSQQIESQQRITSR